jgi:hypothetical protein
VSSVVVSSMRNEGAFLLEWVCWYRMLGFTDIVVVTNDCTDRSPELLDRLADAGWVEQLRVGIAAGQPGVTTAKLAAARELRVVRRADWVLVCDVDEFLVIRAGAGRLADLLAAPGRAFLGMAINWRVFGSGGRQRYADQPVHQQFTTAIARRLFLNRFVKSLYCHSRWFGRMAEHGPQKFDLARAQAKSGDVWGEKGLVWVSPSGRVIPDWTPDGPYLRHVAAGGVEHSVAQINHYMLRSAESFSLKRGTLSPVAGVDRYTTAFWDKADRRDAQDTSALRYADDFARVRAEAMALPGVARMHYLCCADHVRLIAEKAGRNVRYDKRHAEFLAKAASA